MPSMSRILDRYLIREVVLPALIALVVLTFVLEIPPILREGEQLIAKGVDLTTVAHVLLTLLPQALGLTIPMAVLLGLLVGFGRLSADREFVAMQACGVSLLRVLRPVAVVAVVATVATFYEMIVALPNANQTFREITVGLVATRAESNIKPQVFFEEFPSRIVYVRDTSPGAGWRDVFLADMTHPDETDIFVARTGRLLVDREKQLVQLHLSDGIRHAVKIKNPDEYEGTEFGTIVLSVDPSTVFPRPPAKGVPEKTIAELRADIAKLTAAGLPTHSERFMIQLKFALPIACPVLALIGLTLGASNRKDGKLASFVIGVLVIFAYYVLLYGARALANSGKFPAGWAPWVPNVVLAVAGVAMLIVRVRAAERPISIGVPSFVTKWRRSGAEAAVATPAKRAPVVLVIRVPHLRVPRPKLLDLYIARQYAQVFFLGIVSLLGVFYISTFIDLADKLFRGTATTGLLLRYFFYATPQFTYYVIPMSALVAALVTIGVMTKTSELTVMKACGISLYRAAVPVLLFSIAASAVLFGLQERVLAYSNREADRLNAIIRHYPVHTFNAANRRWMVGANGDIYHYELFDPRANRFLNFSIYHLDSRNWRLSSQTYAEEVRRVPSARAGESVWMATRGWTRDFRAAARAGGPPARFTVFTDKRLPLEAPSYFTTEDVESEHMTYGQLRTYIGRLRTSGFDAAPQTVELQRKIAFPLVTLVMTLIAVPFAVTTGRRGALYGIGVGIVLAIVYWIMLSVFAAMGAGGLITPILAAWAPNILFAACAVYLLLTVRT